MQSNYIRIEVTKLSHDNIQGVVRQIRNDLPQKQLTKLVVAHLAEVAAEINQSYFIAPTKRLGAKPAILRDVERATNIAITIQNTLLKRIFNRLSRDSLVHIGNMLEQRTPVYRNEQFLLLIPVSQDIVDLSQQTIQEIRSVHIRKQSINHIVKLANLSLTAIIEYYFVAPLHEMNAKAYILTVVEWATLLWLKMHAMEVKRLCHSLSFKQLLIYADIIEEQIITCEHT